MKTEDLKNYIFEQLNETSYALQQKLYNGRRDQAHRAAATAHDIHVKNMKMAGKTGPLDPSLMAVRGLFVNDMDKAFASAKKADNRSKKLLLKRLVQTGDGSPNYTPTQESAFNFIRGLKRLNELTGVTDKLANKVLGKRRTQYVNKVRDIMSQDRGPGSLSAADGEQARMNRTQKLVNGREARKTGDAEKPVTGEEYREDYPTKSWSRPVRYGFGGPLS